MKKLTMLRQKLIHETKQLIDEDVLDIASIDQDTQSMRGSGSKKEHLLTLSSDISGQQYQLENGDTILTNATTHQQKLSKLGKDFNNKLAPPLPLKKREGEDNLLSLQKTNLRKHKQGDHIVHSSDKHKARSQLNLHNTLLDIQQEYLNYEMKKAQNEYAIDLDLIQEDFDNQQLKNQPQIDLQKKKKSQFIDLLKKCKICSESDLHYASKPFKLMKKLKDIRIMFERKSNNLEKQLKKSNMNKNKIIEDIKADKVIIRKALPEMAKNYLSEIQQQKRMNIFLREKKEKKAQKQFQSSILLSQNGSTFMGSQIIDNKTNFNIPMSKLASQEPTVIIDSNEPKYCQTNKADSRFKSTSPFRKHNSTLIQKESKTSRNTPISEISTFNEMYQSERFQQNTFTKKDSQIMLGNVNNNNNNNCNSNINLNERINIPVSYLSDYGTFLSQDNSPYIRPSDNQQKSPIYPISQFNSSSKQEQSSFSKQSMQISKKVQGGGVGSVLNQNFLNIPVVSSSNINCNSNHNSMNSGTNIMSNNNMDTLTISTINQNIPSVGNFNSNPSQQKFSINSLTSLHQPSSQFEQRASTKINNNQFDNTIYSLSGLNTNNVNNERTLQHSSTLLQAKQDAATQNNNRMSIERVQYLMYLQNNGGKEQFHKQYMSLKDGTQLEKYIQQSQQQSQPQLKQPQKSSNRLSFTNFNNKSISSLSTTMKTNIQGQNITDRQSLKSDYILIQSPKSSTLQRQIHQRANSYIQNGFFDGTPNKTQRLVAKGSMMGNQTDRSSMKKETRLLSNDNNSPKKKQVKEGILDNVYKFDEDQYFKHQQIYKFEQEQAQILTIKRNQTKGKSTNSNNLNTTSKKKEHKKNESYFHDEYSSNDDSIPSATEAQLDNFYDESKKIQKKVLNLKKGDLQTKIKSLLRIENINNEISKLVHWKMKK